VKGNAQILLVAFGNASRRDDGVAFHILQRLAARLGASEELPDEQETKLLGGRLTLVRLHQLTPELAEDLQPYGIVIVIDAHVDGVGWDAVHWREIKPTLTPSMVSHHLSPASLLALCETLYDHRPRGYALSVLGTDFDFGQELSPGTAARANEAVEQLLRFLAQEGIEGVGIR